VLKFASCSEGGKSRLFRLDFLVPVQRVQRADEQTRTADLLITSDRSGKRAEEGRSLAPKKRPGSKPKLDERASKLLEEDIKERPFITLQQRCEYLRVVASVEVSRSTMCRAIKRMNATREKGGDQLQNVTSS
jgi:hypothetical protein